jgi:hypothetical protein
LRTALFCPFTAGTVLWCTQGGGFTLTVAVRGTFSLAPGRELLLADAQEPVGDDRHDGDDPRRSLRAPSDLALYKPRADVVLVGSAYAPFRLPTEALIARLQVGELDKSIGVIGDRVWIDGPDGPEPSAPQPFTSMPLCFERAVRARDNPHGFDLAAAPAPGAPALPNLEAADDEIGRVRTIGFGPVVSTAASRRGLLTADGWAFIEGGGRGAVPAGFDFSFFNAAPRDQQLDFLRPGAPLVLTNLHRTHARLATHLPLLRPKAFLVPGEIEAGAELPMRCDTLWIDTDRALCTLTWRGVLNVASADEDALGSVVIVSETPARTVGLTQIARLLRDGFSSTTDGDGATDTLSTRREPRADSSPLSMRIVPLAAHAPKVIEAEDSSTPIWDELSSSELFELTGTDIKTLTGVRVEPDEPSTFRFSEAPPAPQHHELGPADYARIAAAVERGDAARVLFAYRLTLPDLPNLQRIWSERCAADAAFAASFQVALAEARGG